MERDRSISEGLTTLGGGGGGEAPLDPSPLPLDTSIVFHSRSFLTLRAFEWLHSSSSY